MALGSAFHSPSLDERQAEFRKLLAALSEHLQPDDIRKCSFIHHLPDGHNRAALDTLEYLMKKGAFSHSSVEPLVALLKDISRCDLVTDLVEPYREKYPAEVTSPDTAMMQANPSNEQSPLASFSLTHTQPLTHTQSLHNPVSPAMQEMAGASLPSPGTSNIPSTPTQRNSQESYYTEPGLEQSQAVHHHTQQILSSHEEPDHHGVPAAQQRRVYTAVKIRNVSSTTFPASTSSSMDELERYNNNNQSHSEIQPVNQTDEASPSEHQYNTATTPHAQTPVKNGTPLTSRAPPGLVTTPLSSSQAKMMSNRSMSATQTRRSMTPPACMNKRVSEPFALGRGGFGYNSLPLGCDHFRPVSWVSGHERGQQTPTRQVPDDDRHKESEVFQQPHQTEEHTGTEASPQHAEATIDPDQSGTVFRKRANSTKRRLLGKLPRFRNRSSSLISWSVKRDKLNEAIYRHCREKLLKCPYELELENGGKHAPRLTLYLHPYGYESDAGNSLTLLVTLEASVKSNIPSSALILIDISVNESSERKPLNKIVLKCSGDFRITRHMSFLSHQWLKELECDSIEFQASARLYS